jgi:biopolymer transport protein ExbB
MRGHFKFLQTVSLLAWIAGATLVVSQSRGASPSLADLADRQQEKLEGAVQRLTDQREAVLAEKLPMTAAWNALQEELRGVREKAGELQAIRDSRSVSLERLEGRLADRHREHDYIARALSGEFLGGFESALSVGELATEGEAIRRHHLLNESGATNVVETLESSLKLMEAAASRIEDLIGGHSYSGTAVGDSGRLVEGEFLQVGPLLYFVDSSGGLSGWVEESRSLKPTVLRLDHDLTEPLRTIIGGEEGLLPVDPSLGDAIAIENTEDSMMEHLGRGGIWVYPIILFAVISSIVGAYKFFQIFTIRQPPHLVVHEIVKLLRQGDKGAARTLAERQPEPSSALLLVGIEHAEESIELVEEVLYESMLSVQPKLERFLNVIAVTAATAPLLGLLGTVTGIIKTFKLMQVFGAGDPKPLMAGISEALITTELGLILAIPSLLLHALLSRKVAAVLSRLEKLSVAFVNGLSRRSLASSSTMSEGGAK